MSLQSRLIISFLSIALLAIIVALAARNINLASIALAFGLAALLTYLMTRRSNRLAAQFKDAAAQIGPGKLNTRLEVDSGNEPDVLTITFDQMTSDLSQTTVDITKLRQTEQALRESEEHLRQVFNSISDHIYVTELTQDGQRLNRYISPTEPLTGYQAERIEADWSLWASKLIHPEDRDLAAIQAERFAQGQNSEIEYRLIRADGRTIWVRDNGRVDRDPESGNLFIYGVVSDITDRKKSQAALEATNLALQQSNQRLGAMYEIAQMISSQLDLKALLNSIARNAAKLLDADTCAILLLDETTENLTIRGAYGLSESVLKHNRDLLGDNIAGQVAVTGEPVITDNLPGDPRYNNPVAIDEGLLACASVPLKARAKIIGALNVYSKTEHRAFDDDQVRLLYMLAGQAAVAIENVRLYEEEQRQRKIANSLREVATAISGSLDLEIVLNKIFEQLEYVINYDGAVIILQNDDYLEVQAGRNIPDHYMGVRLPINGQNLSLKPFRDKKVHIVCDVQQDPDWEYWPEGERIRSWMGAPLLHNQQAIGLLTVDSFTPQAYRVKDGRVLQIFANQAAIAIKNARLYSAAQKEIIEHERTEEALMKARDQAIEANKLKTQLLAKVSHELRTPLGAILGYTELMQNGVFGALPENQHKITQEVIDSTYYLTQIVSELLDQAKLETGEVTLDARSFDPKELVGRVETKMNVLAQAKGLRLTTTIAADMPSFLLGDPQRLQQILFNLVSNAIKFTKIGQVSVSLYCPDQDHWAIEVNDTGLGIPQNAQTYIFEPFRQIDGSMTREQNGTGLGLSIVKQLVDLMNGEIRLRSQVSHGSTFTIILPLVPNYLHDHNRA